jgi:hypothetical protein
MCSETYPNSTCVVAHALARSGERNRGTGQKARSGCGKARGTFVFRLHQDALANSRLDNGVLSFDIGATLNSYGEDVPGGSGRVCEGYAAFIYGFDMHRNVWLKMRNRVRDGYQTPYASAAHKRQSVRVVGGVVQLRGSSGSDAGGGGGGGGGGGADTSASPVKKRTRRGKQRGRSEGLGPYVVDGSSMDDRVGRKRRRQASARTGSTASHFRVPHL